MDTPNMIVLALVVAHVMPVFESSSLLASHDLSLPWELQTKKPGTESFPVILQCQEAFHQEFQSLGEEIGNDNSCHEALDSIRLADTTPFGQIDFYIYSFQFYIDLMRYDLFLDSRCFLYCCSRNKFNGLSWSMLFQPFQRSSMTLKVKNKFILSFSDILNLITTYNNDIFTF